MALKCFAPTIAQFLASILIFSTVDGGLLKMFRNTLVFRSFQISHEVSMMRELMAFL